MLICPENAKQAIHDLTEEGLHPDLDQIAMLIELGRRVENPSHRTPSHLEGVGVRCGTRGPRLTPLTIEDGQWFDWATGVLTGDAMRNTALAFACDPANSGTFGDLYELAIARKALKQYRKKLACNQSELESALTRLMDEETPGDRAQARRRKEFPELESNTMDISEAVAQMVSVIGLPDSYWYSRPLIHGMRVLTHAIESQSAMFGGSGDGMSTDEKRVNFDFLAAIEEIGRDLRTLKNGE